MKKINYFILVISILIAFYEIGQSDKNVIIIVIAFVLFMFSMMRLSSKIPSKNLDNNNENVD
jgi:hypothetical protein